ncbi:MAG: YciI family protein [Rudaea sp.]
MSEYVLLYRNTSEAHHEAMGSPERAQVSMSKWRAWMNEMTDKGLLKNVGQPLERVGRVVSGKKKTITDGPYAEVKDVIGGFSIVEARDLDHAAQIASGCPVLEGGGSVEVRPVLQLNL